MATYPQQSTYMTATQPADQQTGIDISSIMNLMLPPMIVVMMMGMMVKAMSSVSRPKQLETAKREIANSKAKKGN